MPNVDQHPRSDHPADGGGALTVIPQRGRNWRARRWLPTLVAVGVVAGVAVGLPTSAGAAVDLPDRTPEQVLEMVAASTVRAMTGTLEQSSDLGLPSLPVGATGGGSGILEMLTGSHTARLYMAPDAVRMQVLDPLAERDVVCAAGSLWTYDSAQDRVTHMAIADEAQHPGSAQLDFTPADLANQAIAAMTPTTQVSIGRDGRVAGRTAYELILRPSSDDTLVETVTIAVDSQNGWPLSVAVRARGVAKPAVSVAFTSLDFRAPDPGVFDFAPPPGATVTEVTPPAGAALGGHQDSAPVAAARQPRIVGTGWDAVAVFPAGTAQAAGGTSGSNSASDAGPADALGGLAGLLAQLTTSVPEGAAIHTSLVSALVTPDGQVLVGAVPVDRLREVARARPR